MGDLTGMMVGRVSCWPKRVTNTPKGKPDPKRLEAARYYDLVNFARHVKVPTYVTVGMIDSVCPPTTVYAMFNQLPCDRHIQQLPLGHVQSGEGENNSRRAMQEFLRRKRE